MSKTTLATKRTSLIAPMGAAALALAIALTGCNAAPTPGADKSADDAPAQSQDADDAQKQGVAVTIDEGTLTVALEANATTGYTWAYTMDAEGVLVEQSDEYVQDAAPTQDGKDEMVGVGGTQTFGFSAGKDGTVTVTFTYAQQWEGGSTADTVELTFTVKDGTIAQG